MINCNLPDATAAHLSATFSRSSSESAEPSPVVPHTNAPVTPLAASEAACCSMSLRLRLPSAFIGVNGAAISPSSFDFMDSISMLFQLPSNPSKRLFFRSGSLLKPNQIRVVGRRYVQGQPHTRRHGRRSSRIEPFMDLGMAVGEGQGGAVSGICRRVIHPDDRSRLIGITRHVHGEVSGINAVFSFVHEHPRHRGSGIYHVGHFLDDFISGRNREAAAFQPAIHRDCPHPRINLPAVSGGGAVAPASPTFPVRHIPLHQTPLSSIYPSFASPSAP